MSTTVQLLGPDDELLPTDWVRPLMATGDGSGINTFSTHGGTPLNHLKWVPASDVFGEAWLMVPLAEIAKSMEKIGGFNYEVIRGKLPPDHVWDWRRARKLQGA